MKRWTSRLTFAKPPSILDGTWKTGDEGGPSGRTMSAGGRGRLEDVASAGLSPPNVSVRSASTS